MAGIILSLTSGDTYLPVIQKVLPKSLQIQDYCSYSQHLFGGFLQGLVNVQPFFTSPNWWIFHLQQIQYLE